MKKMKTVLAIIGSIVVLGAALVASLGSDEETIERPKKPEAARIAYDKAEKVELKYEDERSVQEDLEIEMSLDNHKSSILLELRTQNFDNLDWKEEAVQFKKPTTINGRWSEIYVMHPSDVEIVNTTQAGYTVPKHKWIRLIPAEEDRTSKIVAKHGQKLINEVVKISIPFPNADKALEEFMRSKRKEKSALLKQLEDLAREGYEVTRIPADVQRNISSNLTARHYEIQLDLESVDSGASCPMYLWVKTALGDPSIAPDGSVQNRYGIHNQVIPFSMVGKKGVSKDDIVAYSRLVEEDGNYEVFIKKNGAEKRLTHTPEQETDAVLSPDKKKIALAIAAENVSTWRRKMSAPAPQDVVLPSPLVKSVSRSFSCQYVSGGSSTPAA